MNKKIKLAIAVGVILIAFSTLMFSGFNEAKAYYMTIDEVLADAEDNEIADQKLKVTGKLVGDSVQWDPERTELRFKIVSNESKKEMSVLYNGVKPDNFNHAVDVIVDGKYTVERVFVADTVLTKCPSKYEEGQKSEEQ